MNMIMPGTSPKTTRELPPLAREIGPNTEGENLIEHLQYKTEPIMTGEVDKNGKSIIELNEVLLDFGDMTTNPKGLDKLKKENKTFELLKTMFVFAISEIQIQGKPGSVNIFIKDFTHPNIINFVDQQEKTYNFHPENMCFELLEDNYGKIDDNVLNNLIKLKNRGYNFAIDDFSLEHDNNDVSFENLVILLSNGIIPNYVKIDGKYLSKIFEGKITKEKTNELRLIIKFLKNQGIKIVGEWIGNIEEGYTAKSLGIELFQGKYLNDDFELKKEVNSFKLAKNVESFKLYKKTEKQVIQKLASSTPEEIMRDPEIPLSLTILALAEQTNHKIKRILVAA